MMKRVSSRQRLVSWDAFDAHRESDLSDSEYSDNDSPVVIHLDKRKRSRKHLGPVLIPDTTVLEELTVDVQVQILSFLDVKSLRSICSVNHQYRSLILSEEYLRSIWKPVLQQYWPVKSDLPPLVDSYSLPTAMADGLNLPLLLSMTPRVLPTHVDEALLDHPSRLSLVEGNWINHQFLRAPMPTKLAVVHQDSTTLIRYTGPIGSGDRCVRANHPLPRPLRRKPFWSRKRTDGLFERICQGARAVSRRGANWTPFCAPHLQEDGSLDVTPRMIAYYEVEILAQSENTVPDDEDSIPPITRTRTHTAECVAVGIATENFHIHSRMPGWDSLSFGYHGDDGGIFHSSGGMVEHFGPTFGKGDIVGCGIDYVAQAIFFTLNGKFLGYGWKNIGVDFLQKNLYPVVGIDTNAFITLNFGTTKPFKFDLTSFHQRHSKLIQSHYQYSRRGQSSKSSRSSSCSHSSAGSTLSSRFSRRSLRN